jgi:osmoprotectant transport system substrate-binding protein
MSAATPAPAPASTTSIRIGTKDFTEQFILGEMYALLLENAGFKVERKFNLGPTPVAHAAMLSGEIDLYPEYTGTALLTVLKLPSDSDPQRVYDAVAKGYKDSFDLIWLDPAPMNNTQALAMTKSEASRLRIVTISDFVERARELAAQGQPLVVMGPPEFLEREDGLPGLKKAYGDFEIDYRPVATADRYQALTSGEANAVVAFGTDGEIGGFDLPLLLDDKAFFPPYQVAPVVRQQALDQFPQVREILNALAPKLNDGLMRQLNFSVTNKNRSPQDVARAFLILERLIPGPRPVAAPQYVGSYRINVIDTHEQIAGQFTLVLNEDGTAAITRLNVSSDELRTENSTGTWAQDGNQVKVTLTETEGRPLQQPLVIDLTFDGHFITSVVAENRPPEVTGYQFFLGSGDRHPAIRELHEALANIPWLNFTDPGPSDDEYDEETRQTVVAFQTVQGLLPTGIVDAATWEALKNPQQPDIAPALTPSPTASGRRALHRQGRMRLNQTGPTPTFVPTHPPPTRPPQLVPTAAPPAQPGACSPTVTVGSDATNLRQGPSTSTPQLAVMPPGATLPAQAKNRDGTWYQVDYNGVQGWVFGELVTPSCVENLLVVDVPVPTPAPAPPPAAMPQPPPATGDKVVYLTFDDGPHATWTPKILELLEQYGAKATFFQIGKQVQPYAEIVKQQLAAGYDLGNHTWDHASLAGMPQAQFNAEVENTGNAQRALGAYQRSGPHCMRPPYGATDGNTRPWAEALGYRTMLWTVDPQDWALPGAAQIANHIITHAHPGSIILMHDGGGNRSQTYDALGVVLQTLSQQGYRFETQCP